MSACKLFWFHKGENQIREVDRHSVPQFAVSNHLNNIISYKMLMALNSGPLVGVNGSRYKKTRNFHEGTFLYFSKSHMSTVERFALPISFTATPFSSVSTFRRELVSPLQSTKGKKYFLWWRSEQQISGNVSTYPLNYMTTHSSQQQSLQSLPWRLFDYLELEQDCINGK